MHRVCALLFKTDPKNDLVLQFLGQEHFPAIMLAAAGLNCFHSLSLLLSALSYSLCIRTGVVASRSPFPILFFFPTRAPTLRPDFFPGWIHCVDLFPHQATVARLMGQDFADQDSGRAVPAR